LRRRAQHKLATYAEAMWSPIGQPVMIPTPGQPTKRYGIGAVDYHTGETVVLVKRHKRRKEVAELLEGWPSTGASVSMWRGTRPPRMRTTRWRRSRAEQPVGWCCCTCRPTARG
jgi:hypothetical protein